MRKKMLFLLEYGDYLRNIINKTEIDDLNIYNQFKEEIIVEGLLHTYPNDFSLNIILKRFKELEGNVEPDGEIFIKGDFDELKKYVPIFNNLGYFISTYTLNGDNWFKWNNDINIKPIALFLEAKFDQIINNVPEFLYHTTLDIFANKILKSGLSPKSKSKVSYHPERIYLTNDIKIAHLFGKNLLNDYSALMNDKIKENDKIINNIKTYNILEINTISLYLKLYKDVNLINYGYYILSYIPPSFISKIF